MQLVTQAPRGTSDKLPREMNKWYTVEQVSSNIAQSYGCKEIRTPIFEHTELFLRGVGDTTDIVQKEMYTFNDLGGRSITLKPEGTAGAVRASIENGLLNDALPLKLFYLTRCYRYERSAKGRYREFNQFGVEYFGTKEPVADAEVISLANDVISGLGIKNYTLEINSIGTPKDRAKYQEVLKAYYTPHIDEICDDCRDRLNRNPMRLLDCKERSCQGFVKNAPLMIDYLGEESAAHFEGVKAALNGLGIDFVVNPKIVRGLDYYTDTVFEFIAEADGFKGAICAGGRYDGLVEELGGKPTAGLGFAAGIERLIMVMTAQNADFMPAKPCDIYIGSMGEQAKVKALALTKQLRENGFWAECDISGRGLNAQMKYANKLNAAFSVVLGDNELTEGKATLKSMTSGEKYEVSLTGDFYKNIAPLLINI